MNVIQGEERFLTSRDIEQFLRARTKLQRIRDMRLFNGWVRGLSPSQVQIQLRNLKTPVMLGDKFSLEIAGRFNTAALMAEVSAVNSSNVTMAVRQAIRLTPKIENVRFWMYGMACQIIYEDCTFMTRTIDVSEKGISVLMTVRLPKGSPVAFEVVTSSAVISGTAEVLYSRVDPHSPNQFRCGLQLGALSRIQQARWDQLVLSVGEAA